MLLLSNINTNAQTTTPSSQITYVSFYNDSIQGWIYEVKLDNKAYIRQEFMPQVEGYVRFASKADADKLAALVVTKMQNGSSMPSVSRKELVDLGLITQ